ncbi:MAG: ribbon-helix-helix protein, CopG family [Bryobacteraceae bacterium]
MTHRTTFALDEATGERLRRLAARWGVSQAEVVRRAVERAEAEAGLGDVDPIARLRQVQRECTLSADVAHSYLAEVREDRQAWRGE